MGYRGWPGRVDFAASFLSRTNKQVSRQAVRLGRAAARGKETARRLQEMSATGRQKPALFR